MQMVMVCLIALLEFPMIQRLFLLRSIAPDEIQIGQDFVCAYRYLSLLVSNSKFRWDFWAISSKYSLVLLLALSTSLENLTLGSILFVIPRIYVVQSNLFHSRTF